MKILITGATGRVGSRFAPHVLQKGHAVRVLLRDESKAKSLAELGAEVIKGDLNDAKSLIPAVKGIDLIIHLAAYFRVRNDDEGIKKTNESGTIALAEAAISAGVKRFVFASTGLVYGQENIHPSREEDQRNGLLMAYPASKIAAENSLLKMYKEKNFDIRIARLGFVYGAGDPHMSEVVPLLKAWNWHPSQRLHIVHHLDIGQALMLLALTDGLAGEAYNVADDAPMTAYDIALLNGNSDAFSDSKAVLKNPWEGILDTSKIRRDTGFRPLVPSYYVARDMGIL
jgi:nucleoside-diphosphate-sugar epimerase